MLTSRAKLSLAAALAAMVALCIAGVVSYVRAKIVVSHYPTLKGALDDGARERGWLPSFVPDGAFDLHEAHDLDTNLHWGTFRFDEADGEVLVAKLRPAERDCRLWMQDPGLEGWPVDGSRELSCDELETMGYRVFRALGDPRWNVRYWVLVREGERTAVYGSEFGSVSSPR